MKNKLNQLGLLLFVFIGVVPFAAALIYAFLYSIGLAGVVNEGFTWYFWEEVLTTGEFFKSFAYSAVIAAISVILSVSGALWISLRLRQELENPVLAFVIYLPLAVPGVVAAFFTFQLFAKSGFFARIAYRLGWIQEARQFPDLVNDHYALGIIVTFISVVLPFFVLLFLNVYKNERIAALSELAASLGANSRQILWRISLPILLHKTWILIALYFIFLLGAYEVPLILGQESPQMLSVLIIREIKQYDLTKISEGYVVAVMYTVVVSCITILLFLRKKRTAHEF